MRRRKRGFTLIELVMVILLLGILAAVAIPNFIDFRTDAKNSATQGALGTFRAAMAIAVAAIQLREDPTAGIPKYPTLLEMRANAFDASHPALSGTNILDAGAAIPQNPWTLATLPSGHFSSISDCDALAKGTLLGTPADDRGWCYNETTGQIWANSDRNGSTPTENTY